jgi:hypothetical protein
MPGSQLYAVGFDMRMPYNVYGGLQDNGSHKGPSTKPAAGRFPSKRGARSAAATGSTTS